MGRIKIEYSLKVTRTVAQEGGRVLSLLFGS